MLHGRPFKVNAAHILTCHSRKTTGDTNLTMAPFHQVSQPSQWDSMHNNMPLERAHLNSLQSFSMLTITPAIFLQWRAKMSAVRKVRLADWGNSIHKKHLKLFRTLKNYKMLCSGESKFSKPLVLSQIK